MASKEHKIVRRAEAMAQLGMLSKLLAERFSLEAIDMNVTNRDAELAEIQRIESVNQLLTKVLEADEQPQVIADKKLAIKSVKHGAKQ